MMWRSAILALLILAASTSARSADEQHIPAAGEQQTYKGFTFYGTTFKDRKSEDFFRIARLAVDMLGELPDADWNRSQVVRTIYYNPPSKFREPSDKDNITATYVVLGLHEYPGPIVMYRSARYATALELALSLVGAGIYADDHRMFAAMHARLQAHQRGSKPIPEGERQEFERLYRVLHALLSNTAPPDLVLKADCRVLIAVYNALRVLNPESLEFNLRIRQMNERGCL